MILVDSSVWIDYFNGIANSQTDQLDALLGTESVAVGDLILTEVLQGFRLDKDYRRARELLTSLDVVDLVGPNIALAAAGHYRSLRRRGVTIRKTIDTLIATWCMTHRVPLLYRDRDFDVFVQYLGLRSATDIELGS